MIGIATDLTAREQIVAHDEWKRWFAKKDNVKLQQETPPRLRYLNRLYRDVRNLSADFFLRLHVSGRER